VLSLRTSGGNVVCSFARKDFGAYWNGFVRAASTPVSLIFAAIVLLSDDSGRLNYGIALFVIVIVDLRNPTTTSRNVAFVCVYPNKHKLICVSIRKRPPKLRTP
jgi:hypothetical protein